MLGLLMSSPARANLLRPIAKRHKNGVMRPALLSWMPRVIRSLPGRCAMVIMARDLSRKRFAPQRGKFQVRWQDNESSAVRWRKITPTSAVRQVTRDPRAAMKILSFSSVVSLRISVQYRTR